MWSPPKSLDCKKGSRLDSGLFWKLLGLLLVVCILLPLASVLGILVAATGGTSWLVVLLLLLRFYLAGSSLTSGLLLILLLGPYLIAVGGPVLLLSWFSVLLSGLLLGYPAIDQSKGSKSVEVQSVWEVYDDRLQFMSKHDAIQLDASLDAGDVSRAWLVWSGAAEDYAY